MIGKAVIERMKFEREKLLLIVNVLELKKHFLQLYFGGCPEK